MSFFFSDNSVQGSIHETNLISYYSMNDISGSTLNDYTGTYNGTISGATTIAGYNGNCLSFDGVNDQVSFSASAWSELTGDFTIICRCEPTKNDSVIISKYAAVPAFFDFIGRAAGSAAGKAGGQVGSGPSTNAQVFDPAQISSYGSWPVIVLRQSGTTFAVYVNDMSTPKATNTVTRNTSRSTDVGYIGRRAFASAPAWFGGKIDSLAVYNAALTQSEMEQTRDNM